LGSHASASPTYRAGAAQAAGYSTGAPTGATGGNGQTGATGGNGNGSQTLAQAIAESQAKFPDAWTKALGTTDHKKISDRWTSTSNIRISQQTLSDSYGIITYNIDGTISTTPNLPQLTVNAIKQSQTTLLSTLENIQTKEFSLKEEQAQLKASWENTMKTGARGRTIQEELSMQCENMRGLAFIPIQEFKES